MLGHLSKENNFPELGYQTTVNELIQSNVDMDNLSLTVADRDRVNNIIEIKKVKALTDLSAKAFRHTFSNDSC